MKRRSAASEGADRDGRVRDRCVSRWHGRPSRSCRGLGDGAAERTSGCCSPAGARASPSFRCPPRPAACSRPSWPAASFFLVPFGMSLAPSITRWKRGEAAGGAGEARARRVGADEAGPCRSRHRRGAIVTVVARGRRSARRTGRWRGCTRGAVAVPPRHVIAVWTQPRAGSHTSSVQASPSSQDGRLDGVQAPADARAPAAPPRPPHSSLPPHGMHGSSTPAVQVGPGGLGRRYRADSAGGAPLAAPLSHSSPVPRAVAAPVEPALGRTRSAEHAVLRPGVALLRAVDPPVAAEFDRARSRAPGARLPVAGARVTFLAASGRRCRRSSWQVAEHPSPDIWFSRRTARGSRPRRCRRRSHGTDRGASSRHSHLRFRRRIARRNPRCRCRSIGRRECRRRRGAR